MRTILRLLDLAKDARTEADIIGLITDEANACIESGDLLGAGEWLASSLDYASGAPAEATTAKVLALWASAGELSFSPSDMKELSHNLNLFDDSSLARSLVGLLARRTRLIKKRPELVADVAFRLSSQIEKTFGIAPGSPSDLCDRAAKRLTELLETVVADVRIFQNSACISARNASINLFKHLRQLKPLLLLRETTLLSTTEILLGSGFREFCQSYEKGETPKVVLRLPDIRTQAQQTLRPSSIFAPRFFQTTPHSVALALRYHFSSIRM
jgi:hypothetical protein